MIIQVVLTQEEENALALLLGVAIGTAVKDFGPEMTNTMIRLTNKLMANNPDYIPYKENQFPPKMVSAQ